MVKYIVKNKSVIIGCVIIVMSIIGMVIFKEQLESTPSVRGELYFNLSRVFFFLSLGYFIFEWIFEKWGAYKALKNDKMKAELRHLRNQVNPHFFFNTLNALYGMIKKDPDNARAYVLKLSDLMRYALYSSEDGMVSIDKEVAYLDNFIDLNKIRFNKELNLTFDKEIRDLGTKIHPLLLIVLMENAFKHGVEMSTDTAFVDVQLKSDLNHILFKVVNNFDSSVKDEPSGIGVENLRKRLDLLYPEKYRLELGSTGNKFEAQLMLKL